MSMENSGDNWREELKKALHKYKKKNYEFGNYWIRQQIRDEFFRRKIFVLKGGLEVGVMIFLIIWLIVPLVTISLLNLIYETFNWIEVLLLFFIIIIMWFSISSLYFTNLIEFLIIGPSGVYYRKVLRKGFFSWENVSKIEGNTSGPIYPVIKKFATLKIYLFSGKKIKFSSNHYQNREFSKKAYSDMFLNLFYIYSKS
ncbi:MAG: hypothetical protein ACFE9M_06750 [Promethearchaeota archaeon]